MTKLATSFVLGYHGCEKSIGLKILNGEAGLLKSDKDYDWLGPGAYFWEADPVRAWEWAEARYKPDSGKTPFVIGAVIDLGNCLDLIARENLEILRRAYDSYAEMQDRSGLQLPENRDVAADPHRDRLKRHLDCAVVKHLHEMIDDARADGMMIAPFDTVRGMFAEGGELYPGAGFRVKNHIQIAVVNLDCVLGIFIPRPDPNPAAAMPI